MMQVFLAANVGLSFWIVFRTYRTFTRVDRLREQLAAALEAAHAVNRQLEKECQKSLKRIRLELESGQNRLAEQCRQLCTCQQSQPEFQAYRLPESFL